MFSYIKGTIATKQKDYIVLDNGGIGYLLITPLSTLQTLGTIGENACLYTHFHIREDAFTLFGFATEEEKRVFDLLISISGVGPKVALSIMSTISMSQFGLSIITDDFKLLTKAPGVGSKMAQRIILELKDKVKKEQFLSLDTVVDMENSSGLLGNSVLTEAISALLVLGYSQQEASRAVSSVPGEIKNVEEIIKYSLKSFSKNFN